MAKYWTEPFDPEQHVDHFRNGGAGIRAREQGALQYFVRVVGFTFEFTSVDQVRECLAWFSIAIHPHHVNRSSSPRRASGSRGIRASRPA
jgi:hypothetical protein